MVELYCNTHCTLVYCNEAGLKAVENCIAILVLYCNLGEQYGEQYDEQ